MFSVEAYDNEFFRSAGFHRKECPSGAWFWTLNPDRVYSGAQADVEYTFIGRQVLNRRYTMRELRDVAVQWFAQQGHAPMGSYPVLASLWRDDLLFTSASICDFQPHVIDRDLLPQANPVVVPQKCVRLNDLENIGRSGRHLSSFTMLGHHAFNFEGEPEIYWISRTVELCHRFFTEALGADPMELTYVESIWAGGGNAGPCVEVMYEGIEIATLVFMAYKEISKEAPADQEGEINYKGVRYVPMPTRVVDTGYGIERILWTANGTANIYQAVSPSFIDAVIARTNIALHGEIIDAYFRRMASKDIETPLQYERIQEEIAAQIGVTVQALRAAVRPAEAVFTLCDFTRTLLLMLNDHVLPSNKDAGYLVRHLAKRIMTLLSEEKIGLTATEVIALQFDAMVADFPELEGKRDTAIDIIAVELERHEQTMERGHNQLLKEIETLKKKGRGIFPEDRIFFFYDTLGLPLPYIREIVQANSDLQIDISENFWEKFFNQSMALDANKATHAFPTGQAPTDRLYYQDPYARTAEGRVQSIHGDWVVLDQTLFYPEGGGQPADTGTLRLGSDTFDVVETRYAQGTIFHRLASAPPQDLLGQLVHQEIDWSRRRALMQAHSATHLLNATLRQVLGFHVRQMGAQKGTDASRFDIAHYKNIPREQLQEIEERCNEAIFRGAPISTEVMPRGKAEDRYGFFIYQGGFVPFDTLRIVTVEGIDTEACAGTHLRDIQEASLFKILGVSQIQNNVYRFRYSVGQAALEHFQGAERLVTDLNDLLGSSRDVVLPKVTKLLEETKEASKLLGTYEEQLIQLQATDARVTEPGKPDLYFFKSPIPRERAMRHIIRMAKTGNNLAYFAVFKDGAVFIRSRDIKLDLRDAAARFDGFEIQNAAQDMIVFGGQPEAGAAWDIARKLLA